jgi:RNA polymerase sigma factor (sigma-70 family)
MIYPSVYPKFYPLQPDRWIEKYEDYLFNYAKKRVFETEQARDLVQDTFLAAVEKMDKFEYKCSESTWLTGILKNRIFLYYRERSKYTFVSIDNLSYLIPSIGTDDVQTPGFQFLYSDHYEIILQKEYRDFISRAALKLPELWQLVFVKKYLEEESTESICKELNLSLSYYWVICHRIKSNLFPYLR